MKLTKNRAVIIALELYIIIGVFVSRHSTVETIFLLGIFLLFVFGNNISIRKVLFSRVATRCVFISVMCLMIGLVFGAKGQLYTVGVFVCLLLIEMLCENNVFENYGRKKVDLFYITMLLCVIIYMILAYSEGITNIRTNMGDQNYISGVLLEIIYGLFFSYSRSYFLLILLFYAFLFFKKPIYKFMHNKNPLFPLFLIGSGIMIFLSYYWVYYISAGGFVLDRSSFNDFSNRNRALSILYAVKMISETPSLLVWGYGDNLLNILGITGTDYSTHTFYMGMRLVQPHNSVLNLCVKSGIIPALCYFFLVSKVFSRFLNEDNIPYLFPFFINAMFMHGLFSFQWLVLMTIILSLPQNSWKEKTRLWLKRTSRKTQ